MRDNVLFSLAFLVQILCGFLVNNVLVETSSGLSSNVSIQNKSYLTAPITSVALDTKNDTLFIDESLSSGCYHDDDDDDDDDDDCFNRRDDDVTDVSNDREDRDVIRRDVVIRGLDGFDFLFEKHDDERRQDVLQFPKSSLFGDRRRPARERTRTITDDAFYGGSKDIIRQLDVVDIGNNDAVNHDIVNRDVVNSDIVNRDIVNNGIANAERVNQDIVKHDTSNHDADLVGRELIGLGTDQPDARYRDIFTLKEVVGLHETANMDLHKKHHIFGDDTSTDEASRFDASYSDPTDDTVIYDSFTNVIINDDNRVQHDAPDLKRSGLATRDTVTSSRVTGRVEDDVIIDFNDRWAQRTSRTMSHLPSASSPYSERPRMRHSGNLRQYQAVQKHNNDQNQIVLKSPKNSTENVIASSPSYNTTSRNDMESLRIQRDSEVNGSASALRGDLLGRVAGREGRGRDRGQGRKRAGALAGVRSLNASDSGERRRGERLGKIDKKRERSFVVLLDVSPLSVLCSSSGRTASSMNMAVDVEFVRALTLCLTARLSVAMSASVTVVTIDRSNSNVISDASSTGVTRRQHFVTNDVTNQLSTATNPVTCFSNTTATIHNRSNTTSMPASRHAVMTFTPQYSSSEITTSNTTSRTSPVSSSTRQALLFHGGTRKPDGFYDTATSTKTTPTSTKITPTCIKTSLASIKTTPSSVIKNTSQTPPKLNNLATTPQVGFGSFNLTNSRPTTEHFYSFKTSDGYVNNNEGRSVAFNHDVILESSATWWKTTVTSLLSTLHQDTSSSMALSQPVQQAGYPSTTAQRADIDLVTVDTGRRKVTRRPRPQITRTTSINNDKSRTRAPIKSERPDDAVDLLFSAFVSNSSSGYHKYLNNMDRGVDYVPTSGVSTTPDAERTTTDVAAMSRSASRRFFANSLEYFRSEDEVSKMATSHVIPIETNIVKVEVVTMSRNHGHHLKETLDPEPTFKYKPVVNADSEAPLQVSSPSFFEYSEFNIGRDPSGTLQLKSTLPAWWRDVDTTSGRVKDTEGGNHGNGQQPGGKGEEENLDEVVNTRETVGRKEGGERIGEYFGGGNKLFELAGVIGKEGEEGEEEQGEVDEVEVHDLGNDVTEDANVRMTNIGLGVGLLALVVLLLLLGLLLVALLALNKYRGGARLDASAVVRGYLNCCGGGQERGVSCGGGGGAMTEERTLPAVQRQGSREQQPEARDRLRNMSRQQQLQQQQPVKLQQQQLQQVMKRTAQILTSKEQNNSIQTQQQPQQKQQSQKQLQPPLLHSNNSEKKHLQHQSYHLIGGELVSRDMTSDITRDMTPREMTSDGSDNITSGGVKNGRKRDAMEWYV